MRAKIILFDAAGVLFPTGKAVSEYLSRKFGLSDEDLSQMWKIVFTDLSTGKIRTDEFLDKFAEMIKIPRRKVSNEDFTEPLKRSIKWTPGMEKLLDDLAKTEITLALLSDTIEMFAEAREELGYYKHFDKKFLSHRRGILKPDPKAYWNVIDHYSVAPEEIFFIDDSERNVDGAKKLGIKGIVFEKSKQLKKVLLKEKILVNNT